MGKIPQPIFKKILSQVDWQKIYAREYGVGYSEMAILCLSPRAKYHIPKPSVNQVVTPQGNNTAFFISGRSWIELVESLNNRYTSDIKQLEKYEKQFIKDGESYLKISQKLASLDLGKLSNKELKKYYQEYQDKLYRYSVFAWTSFILNNYISQRASAILDKYMKKYKLEGQKQEIYDSLFRPEKKAAILKLQDEVSKHKGKLNQNQFEKLYKQYRWLSCLDIHNKPWTRSEFREHIKTLVKPPEKTITPFTKYAKQLRIIPSDLEYLLMAKRFVYIKDARDDFRRQGVFSALEFFGEIAKRMHIKAPDLSYLQESEVVRFLEGKIKISRNLITQRKNGFVLYLDKSGKTVCLQGNDISSALSLFKLETKEEKGAEIVGMVASKGKAKGIVAIVKGVRDLAKVKEGYILVAVTTHPDYVPAMRRAGAIVTDEGGITSHAAIVSREFGIPCVVGTKNASSILHDGDSVEVDAVEGIIKKI